MKVEYVNKFARSLKSAHRPDNSLIGQCVVIDCDKQEQLIRLDLYKKGAVYYCCIWIEDGVMDLTTSGKGDSRFDAFCQALANANIRFDSLPPEPDYDYRMLESIKPAINAMASATEVERWYIHSVDANR
jgi:hypothetical protein